MWLVSILIDVMLFVFHILFNIGVLIVNTVARLLGKGAVLAYKKYGNKQNEKMEASANEKISAALSEVHGTSNDLDEPNISERNVVVLDKMIKPLSDDSVAAPFIMDDDCAIEIAQNTPVKYVVVELQNKRRLSFAILTSNEYDLIYVGDVGTLTYQGKRWVSFERNMYELKG